MASPKPGGRTPDSDISPGTEQPRAAKIDYFPPDNNAATEGSSASKTSWDGSSERKSSISFAADLPKPSNTSSSNNTDEDEASLRRKSLGALTQRKSSVSSITFRALRNASLPQGSEKRIDGSRIRDSSPPHKRFENHVAFDNMDIGEATKHNTPSLTLRSKHKAWKHSRRSRTFMVGIDENAYSDYALEWLLSELADDGDEVVCVRVLEREVRAGDKQYRDDADTTMRTIEEKNGSNRALSFVLEFAVGKLHETFQRLIQVYQPAMLIVGTKGRSLGGIQGLVNTRNSFSKYCLQYSPVPVIIVRPTEKRNKKKEKRANDASRRTYLGMLAATRGKHEADSEASSAYTLEAKISADEEAHQVAKVLGLPASFDPTIKPLSPSLMAPRTGSRASSPGPSPAPSPESTRLVNPRAESDDDDDDDDDDEFEVMTGEHALDKQQKLDQLHKMEVGEAAALKMRVDNEEEDDDDDDPPGRSAGGS
jgi:nucleotide-binding universal stress UspA family protein